MVSVSGEISNGKAFYLALLGNRQLITAHLCGYMSFLVHDSVKKRCFFTLSCVNRDVQYGTRLRNAYDITT